MRTLIILIVAVALLLPGSIHARTQSAAEIQCITNHGVWLAVPFGIEDRCVGDRDNLTPLAEYTIIFYTYFVGVIGIFAAVMIIWGGYQIIAAAGNKSKIEKAKSTMLSAVFGLMLTLTSWLLLNVINPDLLNVTLKDLDPISTPTVTTTPRACASIHDPSVCGSTPLCEMFEGNCRRIPSCPLTQTEVNAIASSDLQCCMRVSGTTSDYQWATPRGEPTCALLCGLDWQPAESSQCGSVFGGAGGSYRR